MSKEYPHIPPQWQVNLVQTGNNDVLDSNYVTVTGYIVDAEADHIPFEIQPYEGIRFDLEGVHWIKFDAHALYEMSCLVEFSNWTETQKPEDLTRDAIISNLATYEFEEGDLFEFRVVQEPKVVAL